MSTTAAFIKKRGALHPMDDTARDLLAQMKEDKQALVTVKMPRSVRHHRLAWALAQKLSEMVDGLHDAEDAMTMLKIRARHVEYFTDPRSGSLHIIPKSINFASMDQTSFGRLWDRMTWIVCHDIVPGLDEEALRSEILEMVDGRLPERRAA